ncbi:hypothetical protein PBT90_19990 [Algoriphagus halophytocola]|uniref:hypothetical protein n=1 Tax=Algoriphagus halophytocola TaxID=2991499 RepID=UPI0022DD245A|nr:hypothetical protein [Algoriphagus sp. TR-M9]WBL43011.1 hypothetical protein PBT90_19990 [Algoriphagus sp. TR-M9]
MTSFKKILKEAYEVFANYFVTSDPLLSDEIKEILENPKDREEYFKAIDRLKNPENKEKEVKLSLANKKDITLILNH